MREAIGALALWVGALTASEAYAAANDDAYQALLGFTSISSKTVNSAGCLVTGAADFDGFTDKLPTIRDAWLNRDYSVDFYNQRRKQVFAHVVLKRFAAALTEAIYSKDPPKGCSFAITVKYADKFGRDKEIPAVTWKFDETQNAKTNWEKADMRYFNEIAIDYKISTEMTAWTADEPSLSPQNKNSAPQDCDVAMLRANAIFVRATNYCKKNYMDSPAGYYALAMTKQCAPLGEQKLLATFREGMKELDALAKQQGRSAACKFVDDVEKQVVLSATH